MNVSLSIIVPAFNCKDSISRCITSIKQQTIKDFEVIVIDDGSTDGTSDILDRLCCNDQRFKVIHQSNKGVGAARNTGLELANGDVIGWVDSDDYVLSDYFEIMVRNIAKHSVDISMCDLVVERQGSFRYDYPIDNLSRKLTRLEALTLLCRDGNCKSWLMNKCFKRYLFEDIRFPERMALEDYSVLHKIFAKAEGVFYTKETFYNYEENPKSLTHDVTLEDRWNWVYPAAERYEFIKKHYPEIRDVASQSVINFVEDCFRLSMKQGVKASFWRDGKRRGFLRNYAKELSEKKGGRKNDNRGKN